MLLLIAADFASSAVRLLPCLGECSPSHILSAATTQPPVVRAHVIVRSPHRVAVRTSVASQPHPLSPWLRCRASLIGQVSQPAVVSSASEAHAHAVALRASLCSLPLLSLALRSSDRRSLFRPIRPLRFSAHARREYIPQYHRPHMTERRPSLRCRIVHNSRPICHAPPSSPLLPRRILLGSYDFAKSSCTSY